LIYRLSKADGTCGFDAANALPALKLAPSVVATSPQQGETLAFTATFENLAVPMGTPVTLVAVGANGQTRLGTTDAAGAVTIPLVGKRAGSDVVFAVAEIGDTAYFSNEVSVVWSPGKHATFLTAALSPGSGIAGVAATLRATLVDVSIVPNAPIAGATIAFTLGALACNGVTDAQGAASCNIVPTGTGTPTLTASFAGDASFLPSSATQGFHTLAAPDPACFTGLLPGGGTASACVAGASGCQFTSAAFVSTAGVGAPLPADVSVPYGLFQFVATGCGASATLTLTYPGALHPSATYWKFGPTSASPAHWYSLPAQVAGNTLTVTLVDGGAGDSDLAANGTIVDPGGAGVLAAVATPTVPVPTLDRYALLALSALLLAAVARRRFR
jgi:hypothetical protein